MLQNIFAETEIKLKLLAFFLEILYYIIVEAEMAEWSNAHDSKSCYGQLYGGSNPSLCAIIKRKQTVSALLI